MDGGIRQVWERSLKSALPVSLSRFPYSRLFPTLNASMILSCINFAGLLKFLHSAGRESNKFRHKTLFPFWPSSARAHLCGRRGVFLMMTLPVGRPHIYLWDTLALISPRRSFNWNLYLIKSGMANRRFFDHRLRRNSENSSSSLHLGAIIHLGLKTIFFKRGKIEFTNIFSK